ncbi:MAG: hypothetical protein KGH84_14150 [Paracoccaceae bacterium]|nr:hypothetical protein [Paracoccaceae bacterium]
MLHQPQTHDFDGKDVLEDEGVHAAALRFDGGHQFANLEREVPSIKRWTAVAGYVDARGVVVGFLLEAKDGTRVPLDLAEPDGDVRVLTIAQLKAAEAAGYVRAG